STGRKRSHWLLGLNKAQRTWARASFRAKYRCPDAGRETPESSPSIQTLPNALSSRSRAKALSWLGDNGGWEEANGVDTTTNRRGGSRILACSLRNVLQRYESSRFPSTFRMPDGAGQPAPS